ncbi:NgoBV family restriction endonuclease [Helicobacter pylori]|uniref:NgoBV family restriction endonuclease n=3 Tax=Helicobacter pylori TaxID=210 RepID=UPI000D34B465|nr:NgoBV family restriction endonuclease [Helicobacter pylori]MCQ2619644.1 NgoBV family restriction endonuclease [Helicobacter pylori]PUD60020.1 restriction endonuclease [Helicobacter pylori]WQW55932.1 NgoBV family restriction endonuclease [Helicobacter pylori]WRG86230.1 NgoBV family restriction endonuclease [Helicobacter pylori]
MSTTRLYRDLKKIEWDKTQGKITFCLANISTTLKAKDTVGFVLQEWLKDFMLQVGYQFEEPKNSQSFPDFLLFNQELQIWEFLEIKAFQYEKNPAFDIANFESYCDRLLENPQILNTFYLIFAYKMQENGDILIKEIYLHKIYEIAGRSSYYPLKVQVKRGMIYNIRPNSAFKTNKAFAFQNIHEFIQAIYDTLKLYKGEEKALKWHKTLLEKCNTIFFG